MKELTVEELKDIINRVALNALGGFENMSDDELCDAAHDELKIREESFGRKVRLSDKKKGFGDSKPNSYICGYKIGDIITSSWWERDEIKAKSYERGF